MPARRVAAEQATKTTNGVMNRTSPPTTVGSQDPLNDFSGQKFELTPVQMKNENHIPGKNKVAKPLFTDKANK